MNNIFLVVVAVMQGLASVWFLHQGETRLAAVYICVAFASLAQGW